MGGEPAIATLLKSLLSVGFVCSWTIGVSGTRLVLVARTEGWPREAQWLEHLPPWQIYQNSCTKAQCQTVDFSAPQHPPNKRGPYRCLTVSLSLGTERIWNCVLPSFSYFLFKVCLISTGEILPH